MPSPETDLYFFHIPKTAGSSLGHFLRSLYPREQQARFLTLDEMLAMPREQFNRHRYFQSHFGNLLYPLLDRDVPTITFLRDPYEQTISWLFFLIRQGKQHQRHRHLLQLLFCLTQGPAGWIPPAVADGTFRLTSLWEFQTRMLGREPAACWPTSRGIIARRHHWYRVRRSEWSGRDALLERAKQRLDSMAVVGITERFDESLGLVCDFLKVPPPEKSPVERVAPGRSIHSRYRDDPTVPKALARLVERHTFYDRQLYAYANSLLDRQLMNARLGPIARNLEDTPRQAA